MDIDLSISIIGLPNVGKSLIFNMITGLNSDVSPYPISTSKPIKGVVEWTDPRMSLIANVIQPSEIFPLKFQVIDTIGIIPGGGQTLAGFSESLEQMRVSDVLCYVIRAFSDPKTILTGSATDFLYNLKTLWIELCEVDKNLVLNRMTKLDRMISKGIKDAEIHFENDLLSKNVIDALHSGIPLAEKSWKDKEVAIFDSLKLITHKPYFLVLNYDEQQISAFATNTLWKQQEPFLNKNVVSLCGRVEADILGFPSNEQKEFLSLYKDLELTSYQILPTALNSKNRITYFTFGHLGLKQWSVPNGTTAVSAAKRLHTDFANRFVAAEVTELDILRTYGSVDQVKSHGKMRLEGKDYVIHDGDILYFRFGK